MQFPEGGDQENQDMDLLDDSVSEDTPPENASCKYNLKLHVIISLKNRLKIKQVYLIHNIQVKWRSLDWTIVSDAKVGGHFSNLYPVSILTGVLSERVKGAWWMRKAGA